MTTPPMGLTYVEDSDTRLAGTFVVANPEFGVVDDATRAGQDSMYQRLREKGWLDEDNRTITTVHIDAMPAAMPAAMRVADDTRPQPVTVVWFSYHLPADARCQCVFD